MKVHLIKKKTIIDFISSHGNSTHDFENWIALLSIADWNDPNDMVKLFPSADILGNGFNRVVFNIGGNKYRIITSYYFGLKTVRLYIKWIGTHASYTKICKQNKQYFIDID